MLIFGFRQTKFKLSALLLLGLVAFSFLWPTFVRAQTATPVPSTVKGVKLEVKAGFNGYYKLNEWLPLQVSVSFDQFGNDTINGRIEASTTNFDRTSPLYTRAVELTPPSRKTFWLYIMGREFGYNLQVRLVRDDGTLLAQSSSQLAIVPEDSFLLGVVSQDNRSLNYLDGTKLAQPPGNYSAFLYDSYSSGYGSNNSKPGSLRGPTPTVKVVNIAPADLPPDGAALSGLDGLLFGDLKPDSFAGNSFDPAALANALASWTSQGKALLVMGDSGLRQSGLWNNLLPVRDDNGPISLPDLKAMQTVSHAPTAPTLLAGTGFVAAKVKALNIAGTQVTAQTDQQIPLVVTRPFGLGQIWFIAPELNTLDNWQAAPTFWNWLLNNYQLHFSYASTARHATQAYFSQNQLLPVSQHNNLPNPMPLVLFLVLYIGLVGPLNYFVLRHFKRLELGWFTVPLLTVIFSIGAYIISSNNNVDDLVISRVAILTMGQGNDGSFSGANTELASLYSNGRNQFKLQVSPDTLSTNVFQNANPYNYYYGTRNGSNNQTNQNIIAQGTGGGYPGLNIATRSNRDYAFENDNAAKIVGKGLTAQVTIKNNTLSGTVQNNSNIVWNDVNIFMGRRVIKIGDLKQGQQKQIGTPVITGTSLVNQITGYDTSNNNSNNSYSYYPYYSQSLGSEVDITRQKAMVLESLFGLDGAGLNNIGNTFYVIGWASNLTPSFQLPDHNTASYNLTLLFEPLIAN